MNDASAQGWNAGYGAAAGSVLGDQAAAQRKATGGVGETATDRLNNLIKGALNAAIASGELADRIGGRQMLEGVSDQASANVNRPVPSLADLIGTLEGTLATISANVARATRAL